MTIFSNNSVILRNSTIVLHISFLSQTNPFSCRISLYFVKNDSSYLITNKQNIFNQVKSNIKSLAKEISQDIKKWRIRRKENKIWMFIWLSTTMKTKPLFKFSDRSWQLIWNHRSSNSVTDMAAKLTLMSFTPLCFDEFNCCSIPSCIVDFLSADEVSFVWPCFWAFWSPVLGLSIKVNFHQKK